MFVVQDIDQHTSVATDNMGGLTRIATPINDYINVLGYVSVKDIMLISPPDHLPENIQAMFREGAACRAIKCYNAAAAMFRLCLDATTKELLPPMSDQDEKGLKHARKFLHARLEWLFDHHRLPSSLKDLAECVREDGNDGVHDGSLIAQDVDDICDFVVEILEAVYTAPKRLELAKERRVIRRGQGSQLPDE